MTHERIINLLGLGTINHYPNFSAKMRKVVLPLLLFFLPFLACLIFPIKVFALTPIENYVCNDNGVDTMRVGGCLSGEIHYASVLDFGRSIPLREITYTTTEYVGYWELYTVDPVDLMSAWTNYAGEVVTQVENGNGWTVTFNSPLTSRYYGFTSGDRGRGISGIGAGVGVDNLGIINSAVGGFASSAFSIMGWIVPIAFLVVIAVVLVFWLIKKFKRIAGLQYDGHSFGTQSAVDTYKASQDFVNKRAGL